ncbi:phosphotransferase family protein [Enterovirga aerilata]|uniref:Aminoglycoside phosphotransferase family protein n=1 Tax=Enterovirga aerilata TaxID=2730920 RepID=A0A849IGQ0_9HYPH|nr:aminoglycoside phosphotransferase family protein [Enterovirga sp. DB1703]NNM73093.1 aminoglycoside phosphotransferase family protein [Enterovirga sp. DB1703]
MMMPLETADEHEFAGCIDAILSVYPELATARFAIAGRGWHSLAVEADDRLIFKFPNGQEAEAALRREAGLLRVLRRRLSTPVPDMVLSETPRLFSRHEKLPGVLLLSDVYDGLGQAERDTLAADLARFFAELHSLDIDAMRAAGALPVETWRSDEASLEPAWRILPGAIRGRAQAALRDYRRLGPDPLGEVYGFFDAHGWNMAFDPARGRLSGIFDFADSGLGPPHREFVQPSLIHPELPRRAAERYGRLTGRRVERQRIFLLTAAMRVSELAGAVETGHEVPALMRLVVSWFEARDTG